MEAGDAEGDQEPGRQGCHPEVQNLKSGFQGCVDVRVEEEGWTSVRKESGCEGSSDDRDAATDLDAARAVRVGGLRRSMGSGSLHDAGRHIGIRP